ncbi:hypothetical protein BY996DRAFT_6511874 [Phakopsora pachyrhizi]|nr:hypothetical protein BY996DRAFT_6511874 [Phakopsora pachyrhizi]
MASWLGQVRQVEMFLGQVGQIFDQSTNQLADRADWQIGRQVRGQAGLGREGPGFDQLFDQSISGKGRLAGWSGLAGRQASWARQGFYLINQFLGKTGWQAGKAGRAGRRLSLCGEKVFKSIVCLAGEEAS